MILNINEIDIKKWYIKNIIVTKIIINLLINLLITINNIYKFNNKWNYYNNNDIINSSNSNDIILIWK